MREAMSLVLSTPPHKEILNCISKIQTIKINV
jgi:hypothetical protein